MGKRILRRGGLLFVALVAALVLAGPLATRAYADEAYAVFEDLQDASGNTGTDGVKETLTFIRSTTTGITNGTNQAVQDIDGGWHTGTVFSGIEGTSFSASNAWGSSGSQISSDVKVVNVKEAIYPRTMNSWFYGMSNAHFSGLGNINTSQCTDLENCFYNCAAATSDDLAPVSGWNVSQVTTLHAAFAKCSSLASINLSGWDVSHVTNFGTLFMQCTSLTDLDLSSWNMGSVTDTTLMFRECTHLNRLSLSATFYAPQGNTTFDLFTDDNATTYSGAPNYQRRWGKGSENADTTYTAGGLDTLSQTVGAMEGTWYLQAQPRYTVHYEGNGGSGTMADQTIYRDTDTALTANAFGLTGYSFSGWNTAANGSGTGYSNGQTVNNIGEANATVTLYAQWTPNSYTLTYNANGGSVSPSSKSGTYNSAWGELATPTRTGYTFNGWYTAASGGTQVTAETICHDNLTVYAHWTPNSYTLTYDAQGGSVSSSSKSGTYDQAWGTLATPTRTGYTFDGWYTAASGGTQVTAETICHGNLTVYAHWSLTSYSISYNLAGGSASNPASYTIETATFTLSNPSRTGYTFNGWSGTGISGTTQTVTVEQGSTGNRSYTAHWTPLSGFTLTFDAQGGTVSPSSKTGTYDVAWGELPTPTRTGYTFGGWYTAASGGDEITTSTVCHGDATAYAHWTPTSYSVSYDLAGGTATGSNPESYTIETADFTLSNPTRTGYTFAGWTGTGLSGATQTVTVAQGSTGDRSYTATWTANGYTLTYDANGGSVSPSSKAGNYDSAWGELATPTRTGYTFVGWFTEATGGDEIDEDTVCHGDVTAYAHWTANSYTVIVDMGDGTTTTIDATYDVPFEVPGPEPTQPGFSFEGWTVDPDGSGTHYNAGDMASNLTAEDGATVTLHPQWLGLPVTIEVGPLPEGTEVTLHHADGTVATDVDGNTCVAVASDEDGGMITFVVPYDPDGYYAVVTGVPDGYESDGQQHWAHLTPDMTEDGAGPVSLGSLGVTRAAVRPASSKATPRTGDATASGFGFALAAAAAFGAGLALRRRELA